MVELLRLRANGVIQDEPYVSGAPAIPRVTPADRGRGAPRSRQIGLRRAPQHGLHQVPGQLGEVGNDEALRRLIPSDPCVQRLKIIVRPLRLSFLFRSRDQGRQPGWGNKADGDVEETAQLPRLGRAAQPAKRPASIAAMRAGVAGLVPAGKPMADCGKRASRRLGSATFEASGATVNMCAPRSTSSCRTALRPATRAASYVSRAWSRRSARASIVRSMRPPGRIGWHEPNRESQHRLDAPVDNVEEDAPGRFYDDAASNISTSIAVAASGPGVVPRAAGQAANII